MKRVIYNTCVADPWVKVAEILQKDHGYEPVYWIGYDRWADESDIIIPKVFPSAIFHSFWDAWKGVFPEEISSAYPEAFVDIDFLKSIGTGELQAIKMMDRIDYDRYSFNYMERERHFINLVKHWTACFNLYKPDMVISAVVPHRVYDYVLYLLCRFHNIPFICFHHSLCRERTFATSEIYTIGDIFDKDYGKFKKEGVEEVDLPEEIKKVLVKVRSDYNVAVPDYMLKHEKEDKKTSSLLYLAVRFLKRWKPFGSDGFLKNGYTLTYYKNRKYKLEETHFGLLEYTIKRKKTFNYNKTLKKYYALLTSKPEPSEKYIIFFLHYQPEATTSPTGDIFVNQMLCIETLLKHTPNDYRIYVKEHPSQFMSHTQGHTSRMRDFYDDIVKNKRVKLISINIDSYSLLRSSQAVATVSGTVGWEAIVQKKPVILFGSIWYEKFSGVYRITDESSAEGISSFIDNYQYSESDLLAYLMAFSKNSVRAYHYVGRKDRVSIEESECLQSLASEILRIANS